MRINHESLLPGGRPCCFQTSQTPSVESHLSLGNLFWLTFPLDSWAVRVSILSCAMVPGISLHLVCGFLSKQKVFVSRIFLNWNPYFPTIRVNLYCQLCIYPPISNNLIDAWNIYWTQIIVIVIMKHSLNTNHCTINRDRIWMDSSIR